AHRRLGVFQQAVDVRGIVHARGDHVGALAELALELLEPTAARARQRPRAALLVQRAGYGAADAARSAGHQRGLAGKIEHSSLLFLPSEAGEVSASYADGG